MSTILHVGQSDEIPVQIAEVDHRPVRQEAVNSPVDIDSNAERWDGT
jgi:hypothetical protein